MFFVCVTIVRRACVWLLLFRADVIVFRIGIDYVCPYVLIHHIVSHNTNTHSPLSNIYSVEVLTDLLHSMMVRLPPMRFEINPSCPFFSCMSKETYIRI